MLRLPPLLPAAARDLLSDRAVQTYLFVLGLAIRRCLQTYLRHHRSNPNPNPKQKQKRKRRLITTALTVLVPVVLSATLLLVTWHLIFRFIFAHQHTSESYFDDAYKDVLRTPGHYAVSAQLLQWAIVAVVWSADEGGSVAYLLFGFLGAMSASFVLWVPTLYRDAIGNGGRKAVAAQKRRRRTVPASYVASSAVAYVSILKLYPCNDGDLCSPDEGFGSFPLHFRTWLQVLHVVLLLPVLASALLPTALSLNRIRVDSSLLFALLAIATSAWHLYHVAVLGTVPILPSTDCQWSITTDLVGCTLLTLYAVYKDSSASSLRHTVLAALAIPLLSPAVVLATHLCLSRLAGSHTALIGCVQRRVAAKLRRADEASDDLTITSNDDKKATRRKWCNLGLWTKTSSEGNGKNNVCAYSQACENLAEALGKAAQLGEDDGVLSCGCGSMDEVAFYKERFAVRHITGIDPALPEARATHPDDFNVRTVRTGVEDLLDDNPSGAGGGGDERRTIFPPRFFNKIIALDNIYHYPDKEGAWRTFLGMVAPGGNVAVSDVLLKKRSNDTPLWVRMALRLMGIPTANLWTEQDYRRKLAEMGYDGVDVQTISGPVLIQGPWSRFLPQALLWHLDYAIVVASSPAPVKPRRKKKKVAIVGSGLAGLSTAYYLLSSPSAADFDVDVYEANGCLGLAGNTTLIGEQLVDVPARMAALGYYSKYKELLEELDIPTTVVKTDSSFYGSDGNGGHVCHCYDKSSAVNVYTAICVGGLRRLCKLLIALSKLCNDHVSVDPRGHNASQTFGDWLRVNLGLSSDQTFKCKHTGKDKNHDLPSLTCYDNPFAYIMVGSLSWMLSCTWEQLATYPADIVLPYCQGLKMDRLGIGREGQVIRISPSIKVLERALLYGVNTLQCGTRVTGVDAKRTIDGTTYDAVVCAAEAKAVPKIMKNSTSIFGQIEYHPSTIYLHRDESCMPQNTKEWRTWNVEMSSGRKEPQLTFWLNEFYPDAKFDGNVFQTWSPAHQPQAELIIRKSEFERVVHTARSRSIISQIEHLQGKDGIFFAGSYSAYGMGLLEEALISGSRASTGVLSNIG